MRTLPRDVRVGKVNSLLCESAEEIENPPDTNRMPKKPWKKNQRDATSWKYRDEEVAWDRGLRQKCSWIPAPRFLGTDVLLRTHQKAKRCLMLAKCNQGYLRSGSWCYCTGKEMLAKQQTESTKIYSIPRRFEGTRKGPFHHKPHKLPHHCRQVLRLRGDELSDKMQ